jgi:hypothetical protein
LFGQYVIAAREPGKGFALDIPLKNSGIRKPEYLDVSAALDICSKLWALKLRRRNS